MTRLALVLVLLVTLSACTSSTAPPAPLPARVLDIARPIVAPTLPLTREPIILAGSDAP